MGRLRAVRSISPPPFEYSAMEFPNVIFLPQLVAAGFSSTSLMYAENTRALKSLEPEASRTLLGCQSRLKNNTLTLQNCPLEATNTISATAVAREQLHQPCHSRTKRLLDVLAHPPVIFLFKIAHGNETSPAANSKLVF